MTLPKVLAAIGALILLFTAYMHMGGAEGAKIATSLSKSDFFKKAVPAVWIMPSVHMTFIAFLSFGLSFYRSKAGAVILIAFGLLTLVDAAIVFGAVGPFIGAYMLAAAGLLILTSGILLRRSIKI